MTQTIVPQVDFWQKEPVLRDFLSPAFMGFLLPKLGFRPKTGIFFSRSGEAGFSRPGEILGRETPLWAAQVISVIVKSFASYCWVSFGVIVGHICHLVNQFGE